MSSDELSRVLWPGDLHLKKDKSDTPEEKVEQALQKALDATTPDRAGAPWDAEEGKDENESRGWFLKEGN